MRKKVILLAALVGAVLVVICLPTLYWRAYPDRAFVHFTGRTLPAGISAIAFRREINDNLLHVGNYWLLTGTPTALKRFRNGTSLEESTDDARWMLPDISASFERSWSKERVVVGFEDDSPRNNWYWIFEGETEALYLHNSDADADADGGE